ncbi:MAG: hypothetical protein ACKVPX_18605 [Myxococcaceae bacterium]
MTLMVSRTLRLAVDGRDSIELGVPRAATVGDVLETLLNLYPKLGRFLASEKKNSGAAGLHLMVRGAHKEPLREGERLYLTAARPLAPEVVR